MVDPDRPDDEERRQGEGRRQTDVTAQELAQLAALAGARVSALEDVSGDIRALNGSVIALGETIAKMATKEEVQESEARQEWKRRRSMMAVAAAILILVALVGSNISVLNEVQKVAVGNEANGALLVECTTPGNPSSLVSEDRVHECFDQAQARSASAIGSISLAILDAAICARIAVTSTAEEVQGCYADRIEARTGTRPDLTP